ncbi:chorismate mutase domain-containing protein [Streptomyces albus]|uniref:Chorismate mutase domain-containing protein n=1 Tax=Streptomyces albus (strain ATCC 21838 / DSM 41398 / FERM P-419 / JCM 4703 / NBRC 107858) TaxID=1081613 RepID=A0A0B5ETN0_STRA4|nr:chorismate mutase domain-containing protein [Streptomyces albus]AOU79345.1 chorismate mutase domain-containing protein [Streptomyces albus]AYN35072.1 chorismate mutase [Streptomyces albus]
MTATTTAAPAPGATAAATAGPEGGPAAREPHPAGKQSAGKQSAKRQSAAEWTGARTEEAAGVIAEARSRIDALDDRIIGLVQERIAVSAVVQEARITSGGRRVNLSRETEILGRYRDALDRPGTTLAMTLLELCRGRA